MTTYAYPDAYLAKFCTVAREARAIEDVTLMQSDKTFSADWVERLTIVQCYILACLENQADKEDLFTAKLKAYREQLQVLLPQAIQDANSTAGTISNIGLFSVPLVRS
jgi:hypothetical protein